jgi:hypothetical protein
MSVCETLCVCVCVCVCVRGACTSELLTLELKFGWQHYSMGV